MWWNGLRRRFPTVFLALLVSNGGSALLGAYFYTRHYVWLLARFTPTIVLCEAAAVVGVFFAMTEHYPRFRGPGTVLLGILGGLGTAASVAVSGLLGHMPPGGVAQFAAATQMYVLLLMAFLLVGIRAVLPRIDGIPIRRSAGRAANILLVRAVTGSMCGWAATYYFGRHTAGYYLVPLFADLAVAALWLFCLTPASDVCKAPIPPTEAEKAEFVALENAYAAGPIETQIQLKMAAAMRSNGEAGRKAPPES